METADRQKSPYSTESSMIHLAKTIAAVILPIFYSKYGIVTFAYPIGVASRSSHTLIAWSLTAAGILLGLGCYYFGIQRCEGRVRNVSWHPAVVFVHDCLLHFLFFGIFAIGNEMALQFTLTFFGRGVP